MTKPNQTKPAAYNSSFFDSIKAALNKENTKQNNTYTEILKLEPGKTYTVRILPFLKDPEKTFYHYYSHGWTSFATGQYVQAISPTTIGERDPISEERFRIRKMGTEAEKEKVEAVRRVEKWLANVYVVEDPTNPENTGKVKILRFGRQLHKIIMEAIEGEDAEEYGARVFDLSDNGVNLRIKVEKQGDFPSYVSSTFKNSPKIDKTEEEQAEILEKAFDLSTVFSIKPYDELKQMFDEHFHCKISVQSKADSVKSETKQEKEDTSKVEDVEVETLDDIDELIRSIN